MIGIVRQMILCVTAASLFGSMMLSLTEQKGQKEIIRIAIGMMLVLALITPLRSIRLPDWGWLSGLWSGQETSADAQEVYQKHVLEEFETELETYLEQCAAREGVSCAAEVTAEQQADTVSIQAAVLTFVSDVTEQQREEIGAMAAQELGISEQQITLAGGEPDGTE